MDPLHSHTDLNTDISNAWREGGRESDEEDVAFWTEGPKAEAQRQGLV